MSNRIAIPIQYIKKLRLIHGLLVKMEVYIDILCLLAQPKEDNTKYKNKKQPELPENQTVWKSDNQGVKEETFIQTGTRGRDRQLGQREHAVKWWLVDQVVPHSCVDKNWEELLGSKIDCQKIKPQNLWL